MLRYSEVRKVVTCVECNGTGRVQPPVNKRKAVKFAIEYLYHNGDDSMDVKDVMKHARRIKKYGHKCWHCGGSGEVCE